MRKEGLESLAIVIAGFIAGLCIFAIICGVCLTIDFLTHGQLETLGMAIGSFIIPSPFVALFLSV